MRIYTNEKHIHRYAQIGKYTSLAGLLLLVGAMIIQFTNPEMFTLSLAGLLIGFALSQIGIYFGNRYARVPRPDQALNTALKGLDKRYAIYHYVAPTAHLLTGPAGMWVLVPKVQRGRITYERGRWRQRGGIGLAYLRIFAQEGIGRPDLEIGAEIESMKKFLARELPQVEFPEPKAALLFTNENAEIDADNAPVPTLPIKHLKDFIRKSAKEKDGRLSPEQMAALGEVLEAPFREDEPEENDTEVVEA